jgi:hypothetical protein
MVQRRRRCWFTVWINFYRKLQNSPYLAYSNCEILNSYLYSATPRRNISYATQTIEGTQARDTFMSLVATTRQLGISFFEYVRDRISQLGIIPSLYWAYTSRLCYKICVRWNPRFCRLLSWMRLAIGMSEDVSQNWESSGLDKGVGKGRRHRSQVQPLTLTQFRETLWVLTTCWTNDT